jgi:HD-GYP domain-containing protein (c-di-GMP phosphodiesterase class II)
MESEAGTLVIRSQHVPLAHVPIDRLPVPTPGVLIVDQDVTEIVTERERRARTLQKLIDALVQMVDNRDPYAANQSASVAMAAREVAAGMGLDAVLVDTTETAGKLMNIGKIVVPRDVLTKTTMLMEGEIKLIRQSLQLSADFIQNIEFDGPVMETLRQMQERFDGEGPLGLKGEEILITARIIAAVNAFVGMVSPRSHRAALPADQAVKILLRDIDKQFDRRVVVALADYVENRKGAEALNRLATKL